MLRLQSYWRVPNDGNRRWQSSFVAHALLQKMIAKLIKTNKLTSLILVNQNQIIYDFCINYYSALFTKQIVKLFHFFNEVFRGKLFPLEAVLFLAI